MNLRTANHKARRALRQKVHKEGFAFHCDRIRRLSNRGQLSKLKCSGYILRRAKKEKTNDRRL